MANGAEHAIATRRMGAVLMAGSIVALVTGHPQASVGLAAGAVGGHLATPDLDLPGLTYCEKRISGWNPLLGFLWRVYWFPYALAVGHRSKWSHMPGVGSAIRMAYLLWWLPLAWQWTELPGSILVAVGLWTWAAWSVQDTMHLHLDEWQMR